MDGTELRKWDGKFVLKNQIRSVVIHSGFNFRDPFQLFLLLHLVLLIF
ncbi:hypothetical protein WG66_011642 [Moniliophthora roreri]|nr:hypothetical protein WG66_011642 [Moniliophthora roreri]